MAMQGNTKLTSPTRHPESVMIGNNPAGSEPMNNWAPNMSKAEITTPMGMTQNFQACPVQ